MPAERTRVSKRSAASKEGVQLTWTTPVDPSTAQSIAFAPTVTPVTFYDPPSPEDPPSAGMLFPPTEDAPSSTRRTGHAKKKPENHIPRPPNAFILFRSSFIKNQHVSSDVETNHSTLSKIIGLTWQNLPPEERQIWHAKAKIALEEHKRKFPQYAFRPLHTKGKGAAEKRKVREVGPKDIKRCEKIAELLVEGKKGAELDAAIAEFDRHHVPQIVTRFEAPITARSYRRSSSAPAPDTEHSKPAFLPSSPKARKVRARSTQPEPQRADSSSQDCPTPVISEFDTSDSSEYSYDSLSSPSIPSPTSSLPDVHPSFDFSTFSFTSASSTPAPCESLVIPPQETAYGFSFSHDPLMPCTPNTDIFDPATFTVSTPFFDPYSPSPDCSMPGTPTTSLDSSAPRVAPTTTQFESTFDFFDMNSFDGMLSPTMSVPMHEQTLVMPSFYETSKPDFACYDGSGLASFEGGLSPQYIQPVPTY